MSSISNQTNQLVFSNGDDNPNADIEIILFGPPNLEDKDADDKREVTTNIDLSEFDPYKPSKEELEETSKLISVKNQLVSERGGQQSEQINGKQSDQTQSAAKILEHLEKAYSQNNGVVAGSDDLDIDYLDYF